MKSATQSYVKDDKLPVVENKQMTMLDPKVKQMLADYEIINSLTFKNSPLDLNKIIPDAKKKDQLPSALSILFFDIIDVNKSEILKKLLSSDGKERYIEYIQGANPSLLNMTLSHLLNVLVHALMNDYSEHVNTLIDVYSESASLIIVCLEYAINNNASNSCNVLLNKWKIPEDAAIKLADLARELGNITILNMLLPNKEEDNQLSTSERFYVSTILSKVKNKVKLSIDEIDGAISRAYLSSNLCDVKMLCIHLKTYFKSISINLEASVMSNYMSQIDEAYNSIFSWGSLITRYLNNEKRYHLACAYNAKSHDWAVEKNAGLANYKIVTEAIKKMPSARRMNKNFKKHFGRKPLARCLNYFSIKHGKEIKKINKAGKIFYKSCKSVRESFCLTPLKFSRYKNMQQYAYYLYEHPTSDMEIVENGYWLTYKGERITFVEFSQGPQIVPIECMPKSVGERIEMEIHLEFSDSILKLVYNCNKELHILLPEVIETLGKDKVDQIRECFKNIISDRSLRPFFSLTDITVKFQTEIMQLLAAKVELPLLYFTRTIRSYHGCFPSNRYFPEMEELFKQLRKNKDLSTFFDKVTTITWLFGNSTPTPRGTGRSVEQLLVLLARYNDLLPIVLKTNLQRDCLNIVIPLSLYKKLFFFFAEPDSLPDFAIKQMEYLYNNDIETRTFVDKFNLHPKHDPSLKFIKEVEMKQTNFPIQHVTSIIADGKLEVEIKKENYPAKLSSLVTKIDSIAKKTDAYDQSSNQRLYSTSNGSLMFSSKNPQLLQQSTVCDLVLVK